MIALAMVYASIPSVETVPDQISVNALMDLVERTAVSWCAQETDAVAMELVLVQAPVCVIQASLVQLVTLSYALQIAQEMEFAMMENATAVLDSEETTAPRHFAQTSAVFMAHAMFKREIALVNHNTKDLTAPSQHALAYAVVMGSVILRQEDANASLDGVQVIAIHQYA